jgi:fatty acid desaturase
MKRDIPIENSIDKDQLNTWLIGIWAAISLLAVLTLELWLAIFSSIYFGRIIWTIGRDIVKHRVSHSHVVMRQPRSSKAKGVPQSVKAPL